MKSTSAQIRDNARRYLKVIEWSDEEACYIGSAPPLIGQCCHGGGGLEAAQRRSGRLGCESFDRRQAVACRQRGQALQWQVPRARVTRHSQKSGAQGAGARRKPESVCCGCAGSSLSCVGVRPIAGVWLSDSFPAGATFTLKKRGS